MTEYRPSLAILELGAEFYDVVEPAQFPTHILRFRNDRAAGEIGLPSYSESAWIEHFGQFQPLPGTLEVPLALRYHGHQFRIYNPYLGDGRGFLFAQMLDADGRLLDLGTKGSGQTPWSRRADGRLTLKGGVREVLAAEMLEALGVSTSRTLSLIETGEHLQRNDEPSPTRSSVLVRLSHSHIRYGSFQRLAALDRPKELRRLIDYVLHHIARRPPGDVPAETLFAYAAEGAAQLAASWHVAGFVHGVLNTDNSNISGESFDYGPWRFLPRFDLRFTAAYFDERGLYAFGRQAEALHWNLLELARTLLPLASEARLLPILQHWPAQMFEAVRGQMLWRLGLHRQTPEAEEALLRAFEAGLQESQWVPDQAWFAFRGGRLPAEVPKAFHSFAGLLTGFTPLPDALAHPYWADEGPETMLIDEVESLWSAIADEDDWRPFQAKILAVRRMGDAHQRRWK